MAQVRVLFSFSIFSQDSGLFVFDFMSHNGPAKI